MALAAPIEIPINKTNICTSKRSAAMDQVLTPQRKALAVRGIQMLIVGVMMNIGVTIIGFLALVQFLWMMFTNERNSSIADLGVNIRDWYGTAIAFMFGNSDQKPFPWKNI
jgi:hypothetical protein